MDAGRDAILSRNQLSLTRHTAKELGVELLKYLKGYVLAYFIIQLQQNNIE